MDFKFVLEKLISAFEKEKVKYGLIGGFALGLYGVNRATVDIDFLVNKDDLDKVKKIMQELNYESRYITDNVSQYVSPLAVFGEVDFLHAFREISTNMLARVEERKTFNESLMIKVLKPEDLIGLKLQAMANNKSRWTGDLADIEGLMSIYGKGLDWPQMEKYFLIFQFDELFKDLKRKYYEA